jgi:hypothetical protein
MDYAMNNNLSKPVLTDYNHLFINGINEFNLNAINSAVDSKENTDVDTIFELKSLVKSYNLIINEANGIDQDITPNIDPSNDDYQTIGASIGLSIGGISGGIDKHSSALSLLNDSIKHLSYQDIDSIHEINSLSSIVDNIITMAILPNGSSIPSNHIPVSQLALLGIDVSLIDTLQEQTDIFNHIISTPDNGSGVNTILALQAIVNGNVH